MFTLELSAKQVEARRGFIVIWNGGDKISRITFELREPPKTAAVAKIISLKQFGEKLFGGFEGRGARIEFSNLGAVLRIIAID